MDYLIFLGTFISLALLDSLNPNGIIVTTIVLSQTNSLQKSFIYLFSIFVTYFVAGIVIFFGLAEVLKPVFTTIGNTLGIWVYVSSVIAGILLIIFSITKSKSKISDDSKKTMKWYKNLLVSGGF